MIMSLIACWVAVVLCSIDLSQWIDICGSLSKTVRKAARVALGKDVSKVQHYVMSGNQPALPSLASSSHSARGIFKADLTFSSLFLSCRRRNHSWHLPSQAEPQPVLFLVQEDIHRLT